MREPLQLLERGPTEPCESKLRSNEATLRETETCTSTEKPSSEESVEDELLGTLVLQVRW